MFLNDNAAYNNGEVVVPPVKREDDPYINIDQDYENIDWNNIDQARINRAKAKAKGRMNLYLLSDYYDEYPTVDAAIVINSGSEDGIDAIKDVRGSNPWASTGGSAAKHVIDLNVQNELLYALYLFDEDSLSLADMTPNQLRAIKRNISTREAQRMGLQAHLDSIENSQSTEQEAI